MTIPSSLFASTDYLSKTQSFLYTDVNHPSQIPEAILVITPSGQSVGAKFIKLKLHCVRFQRKCFERVCLLVLKPPPTRTDFGSFRQSSFWLNVNAVTPYKISEI